MIKPKEILESFNSSQTDKILPTLQFLYQHPEEASAEDVIEKILDFTNSENINIKFWARKLAAKLITKESKDSSKKTQEPIFQQPNNQLTLETLFKKLNSVKSSYVKNEVLKKVFDSDDPSVRNLLFEYLEKCEDPIVVSFITKRIGAKFPDEQTLLVLKQYLKHNDDRVIANTVEGIENIDSPKSFVLISQMLEHPNHRVKANAAKALSKQDSTVSYQAIDRMLSMKDQPRFIIAAMYAIKSLKDLRFIEKLSTLAKDPLVGPMAIEVTNALKQSTQTTTKNNINKGTIGTEVNNIFESAKNFFLEGFLPVFGSIWKWVLRGLGVLISIGAIYLLVLLGIKVYDNFIKAPPKASWEKHLSSQQIKEKKFILALEELKKDFFNTTNKLRKVTYGEKIKPTFRKALNNSLDFSNWVCEVESLEIANSEEVVFVASIKTPSNDVLLGNWIVRNSYSFNEDLFGKKIKAQREFKNDLLISKDSSFFKQLVELEEGDKVKLSGTFFRDDTTFLSFIFDGNINSLDQLYESFLKKPRFLVKFQKIAKLD